MKLLFICEEYPPGKNGGIGTMVQTLGREMVRQGHSVYVVGLYPHGYGQPDYEEDQGVKVWRLRYTTDIGLIGNNYSTKDRRLLQLLKWTLLLQLDTKIAVGRLFRFINRLVREQDIQIIEIPDWNTFFQNSFARIDIPAFDAPLLVKFHGSHSYFRQELNLTPKTYVFRSELALMHRAEGLSSVSKYTAAVTAKLYRLERPIEILYNGINLPETRTSITIDNKKIIFTGSLIYKKGIFSLLQAWNTVVSRHPDATLEIYGKGDITALTQLLSPSATPTVSFKGHVSRDTLYTQLATAAAAIFPSYAECFALAPMEAMAVGCAVINTSRSSGAELISDGINGLLVDPDDLDQIATAIIRLLEDPSLRNKLAAAGKQTILSKFTIRDAVPLHIATYQKIIASSFNNPLNSTT